MKKNENRQSSERINMLSGSLIDKIFIFAVPLALSSILQQLFNSVDVAVVGHFANSQAQAAVGCNGPIINLIINLFIGISVGSNVIIANYIGGREKDKIRDAVHTSMTVSFISGVILLVLGITIARPVLVLMDTPEDVLEYAVLYLRIYSLGMPFIMVYNFGAAILRSIGDTKRPLYCLVLSGLINAGLNLFLVIVFHLDVAGVAIATVISNVVSACMVWRFLMKESDPIRLSFRKLKMSKSELVRMLHIGMPAGLQGMVFSIANVCIQAALNGYGSDAVAGSAVALNFEYFTYFVISAFNQTSVTFTSQNYGAAQYDRCRKVHRFCLISGLLITAVMCFIFIAGKGIFISLFTSDPDVAAYASVRMLCVLSFLPLANTYEIGGASLRGLGYSMTPAVLTVFGTCLLRLVWIYTVCRQYTDFRMLMIVYPISWVITGASVLAAYYIIRKKVFANRQNA